MKTTFLSFILFVFSLSVFSQYNVRPYVSQDKFSSIGEKECIAVKIHGRPFKDVGLAWKQLMKKIYKAKVEDSGMEIFADNANVKEVSENTIDVYSKMSLDSIDYVEFKVAVNLGGVYLTKERDPLKQEAMSKIVGKFAFDQTQEGINDLVKKEEGILKEMIGLKTKYERNIKNANKKISDYKQAIAEKQEEINNNNQDIMNQTLDVDKSKLEKNIKKANKKITSYKNGIVSQEKEISNNKQAILNQNKKIELQLERIKKTKAITIEK